MKPSTTHPPTLIEPSINPFPSDIHTSPQSTPLLPASYPTLSNNAPIPRLSSPDDKSRPTELSLTRSMAPTRFSGQLAFPTPHRTLKSEFQQNHHPQSKWASSWFGYQDKIPHLAASQVLGLIHTFGLGIFASRKSLLVAQSSSCSAIQVWYDTRMIQTSQEEIDVAGRKSPGKTGWCSLSKYSLVALLTHH